MDAAAAAQLRSIAEEFTALHNRSIELFTGLRDLPSYAGQKTWRPYFQRAFTIFTRLWKFQQQHRAVLEKDDCCGLKRHEIGEIASKIGQLYYHSASIRTADTSYLLEAYVFYEAIWDRNYFQDVMESKMPYVAQKLLRYCARFMIVNALLNRHDRVRVLVVEMKKNVDQYAEKLDPEDKQGWQSTYEEMSSFVEAIQALPLDEEEEKHALNVRLPRIDSTTPPTIVRRAVVACCWASQAKFSNISVDMFRFLQLLEREPSKREEKEITDSPEKALLHCPSITTLLLHLAAAMKELKDDEYSLIFFSGPGKAGASPSGQPSGNELSQGGLDTREKEATIGGGSPTAPAPPADDHQSRLHPMDLLTFIRKPLFAVLDSPGAYIFRKLPRMYNAPFFFLCSPQEWPNNMQQTPQGSLFTAFLYHPLQGLCSLCGIDVAARASWTTAQSVMEEWEARLIASLQSHEETPAFLKPVLKDAYLGRLIVRFVVCRITLSHHADFVRKTVPSELPCCHPDLSDTLWTDLETISTERFSKILNALECQKHFR